MDEVIQSAIQLRKAGQYDQSRAQLTTLLQDAHYKALAHLHIAWSYDIKVWNHKRYLTIWRQYKVT